MLSKVMLQMIFPYSIRRYLHVQMDAFLKNVCLLLIFGTLCHAQNVKVWNFSIPCSVSYPTPQTEEISQCADSTTIDENVCIFLNIDLDAVHADLTSFYRQVDAALSISDDNVRISNVNISFVATKRDIAFTNRMLDELLIPRPWWRIREEPFSWQFDNEFQIPSALSIVLSRLPQVWEGHLKWLTSVQFPSSETCSRSSLLVGRMNCVHPGWGFVLRSYAEVHRNQPYAIWSTYFYAPEGSVQNNAWISESDCPPNQLNKWNCAFLPTTNCTLPSVITSCTHSSCNEFSNTWLSSLLTSADEAGQFESPQRDRIMSHGLQPVTDLQRTLSDHISLPPFLHSHPQHFAPNISLDNDILMTDSAAVLFTLAFILRLNAFYRSRVGKVLFHFDGQEDVQTALASQGKSEGKGLQCVAAHIRRGDRLIVGADPLEYCRNLTLGLPCLDSSGKLGPCDQHMGCGEGAPFSTIGLRHVLEKVSGLAASAVIPAAAAKTVILFSDDEDWLRKEIFLHRNDNPAGGWYLLTLPPLAVERESELNENEHPQLVSESYKGYNRLRFQAGTASGVHYMAAMELATRCSALVGHFASGATRLFYNKMCLRHADTEGFCPPVYDFRNGL